MLFLFLWHDVIFEFAHNGETIPGYMWKIFSKFRVGCLNFDRTLLANRGKEYGIQVEKKKKMKKTQN